MPEPYTPLQQAATEAHAARYKDEIARDGGYVLGYILLDMAGGPENVGMIYGPVVQDAPDHLKGPMLKLLGEFMAGYGDQVLAEGKRLSNRARGLE